jgi:hypothetical protein
VRLRRVASNAGLSGDLGEAGARRRGERVEQPAVDLIEGSVLTYMLNNRRMT